MSLVTIAIPTYNRRDYLKESIKSVLAQTFQDFQIMVFDNHSDYDIATTLAGFNDSRIILIPSNINDGNFNNFRRIFNYQFNSPYVVIFHDDDVMHPQMLERELAILEKDQTLSWAGGGLKFVLDGAKINNFTRFRDKTQYQILDQHGLARVFLNNFHLAFDSVMYRPKYFGDIGQFVSRFDKWWDRPALLDMSAKGKVAILQEPLVNYRTHAGQDSNVAAPNKIEYQFNLLSFFKSCLPQPLSPADAKLFNAWSSNSAAAAAKIFSKNFSDYREVLKIYEQRGFFEWSSLGLRGKWYVLKAWIKFLLA